MFGVKQFYFPSFEEWDKRGRKLETSIGSYNLHFRASAWGPEETFYECSISPDPNPLNIYSAKIFKRSRSFKGTETKELEEWYNEVVRIVHEFWPKYIKETYYENSSLNIRSY